MRTGEIFLKRKILFDSVVKSIVIVLLIFFIYLCKNVFQTDFLLGYFIFLVTLIFAFLLFSINAFRNPYLLFFSVSYFMVIKLYHLVTIDPVQSPDALKFSTYYEQFSGYFDLIKHWWKWITHSYFDAYNLYPTFGLLYSLVFELFGSDDNRLINVYNDILALSTVLLMSRIIKQYYGHEEYSYKRIDSYFLILCLCSATLIYYTSLFLKDITSLFFVVLGLYLLINKRWFWFAIVMVISYPIRNYTLALVSIYYLLFNRKTKLLVGCLSFSLIVVMYKIGIGGILKSIYISGLIFLSPNPFEIGNWTSQFFRSAESMLMVIVLLLSLTVFFVVKNTRLFYVQTGICILIYACILCLVDEITAANLRIEDGAFSFGDNFNRKKLMMLPILYLIFAYTLVHVKYLLKRRV